MLAVARFNVTLFHDNNTSIAEVDKMTSFFSVTYKILCCFDSKYIGESGVFFKELTIYIVDRQNTQRFL